MVTYSYDRRVGRVELDYEIKVEDHGDQVHVILLVKNREEWYRDHGYGRGLPREMRDPKYEDGQVILFKEDLQTLKGPCRENAQALHDEVFGQRKPNIWVVTSSGLKNPKLQHLGLGKQMYLKAFKAIAPAIVTADACTIGGQTSFLAARVWESLKRHYPHKGDSAADLVLAVKR